MMFTNFFKRITGIAAIEAAKEQAISEANEMKAIAESEALESYQKAEEAKKQADEAAEAERIAKMSPKERASAKGDPWVAVLDTHINKDNIRNGFFELDWNDEFVLKLKQEGYGYDGDPDEEIVDRWFRELCANVVVDEGLDTTVNTGVIDINSVRKNNR